VTFLLDVNEDFIKQDKDTSHIIDILMKLLFSICYTITDTELQALELKS